jgi:RND family efflux transporter MFP subunit
MSNRVVKIASVISGLGPVRAWTGLIGRQVKPPCTFRFTNPCRFRSLKIARVCSGFFPRPAAEQVQQATRDKAAAELTSAQALKDFESVRAPFAGTITARYIDVGSLVAAGSGRTVQKLFDLNQPDPLRVFVNVPQADVSSVTPGTPATITVDELSGQTFHGNITRDAGAFDQTSRTLLLQIDVPNPEGRLRPGMYAQAKFALQKPAATLLIPDNTIQIDAKGIRVFVVDAAGKIEIKPVKLGRDLGAKSEILTGINTADRVIQNPTPDLRQGMAVSVQPADR